MKIIKRIFLVIAILVGLGVVVNFFLPTILGMVSRDISPIDDHDLQLNKVTLLDFDNAYFDLNAAGKDISLSDEEAKLLADMVTKKTFDEEKGARILQNNRRALELFRYAAKKGKFQDVALADPSTVTFYTAAAKTYEWRQLARLSIFNALSLQRQGKGREATEEAMQSIRVGSSIAHSQATIVEYFMALSMKKVGLQTLIDILPAAGDFDNEISRHIISELANYFNNENDLEKIMKLEYIATSHMVDQTLLNGMSAAVDQLGISGNPQELKKLSAKTKNLYFFQPNKTKEIVANRTRTLLANIDKPCGEIKLPNDDDRVSRFPFEHYFAANGIGRLLTTVSFTPYRSALEKKCQDDLLVGVTQTLFAIKMFKGDTGAYPDSLHELVPKYLLSIPQDPFDGKFLRYSLEKKIIYSVGKDIIDGGGSAGGEWTAMPDPSFPISF